MSDEPPNEGDLDPKQLSLYEPQISYHALQAARQRLPLYIESRYRA